MNLSVHGNKKTICVKNKTPEEIIETMNFLRNQWGVSSRKVSSKVQTDKPSIQGKRFLWFNSHLMKLGPWNPYVDYSS
jgi:hypothetical protein